MSIVSDARSYADSALEQGKSTLTFTLEQGKSTLTFASDRLVSLTSEARVRATTVVTGTKDLALSAYGLARRQADATIGATESILKTITKRTEVIPGEAKRNATKLVDTTKVSVSKAGELAESVTAKSQELAAKAQEKALSVAGDIKERGEDIVEAARKIDLTATTSIAKDEVEGRVVQVKSAFGKLADRGEKAANEVTAVAQKVRARATSSSPDAPATKAPAKKAPAKKAPASKAAAN